MTPLTITDYTLTTALGAGKSKNWSHIQHGKSGLSKCDFYDVSDLDTWIGRVKDVESVAIPEHLSDYSCRNNQLALLGLEQDGFIESVNLARKRHGSNRIGVFVGTSTSGIHQTELAYIAKGKENSTLPAWYGYQTTHNIFSVADFVAKSLAITGVSSAISTACSSSAKVFASAYRAIQSGLCDAAVVGGVDTLCLTTLYGFNSLQLISNDICRPFDENRMGLSIGEGAGFALLEKSTEGDLVLKGYGESSDAYHMSSPHPEGNGAYDAMTQALKRAQVSTDEINYINLHGTGTPANDLAESKAIEKLFGKQTGCSSTKGWTGHTLGAAGIIEACYCLLALENQQVIQSLNLQTQDPDIHIDILTESARAGINNTMTNSFGFGGNNASLILGKSS
jgi:3-oxoacyl-[acyl-carrier-protein] synthase-1